MTSLVKIGNRVPCSYFLTTGKGESNAGSPGLPAETGSYDAALNNAGIQNANVIHYTSVVPTNAKLQTKDYGLKSIKWGGVLESIMAQTNGRSGNHIAAGVLVTGVYDKNNKYLGGFACEYSGNGSEKEAKKSLMGSINGMITRRGYGVGQSPVFGKKIVTDKGFTYHPGMHWIWSEMNVSSDHGTVIAAICFTEYEIPLSKISRKGGNRRTRRKRRRRR